MSLRAKFAHILPVYVVQALFSAVHGSKARIVTEGSAPSQRVASVLAVGEPESLGDVCFFAQQNVFHT